MREAWQAECRGEIAFLPGGSVLFDIGEGVLFYEGGRSGDPSQTAEALSLTLDALAANGTGLVVHAAGGFGDGGMFIRSLATLMARRDWSAIEDMVVTIQAVLRRIRRSDAPIVSVLVGDAVNGELDLALQCSRIHVDADAHLGYTAASYGLLSPFGGLRELVSRCTRQIAGTSVAPADVLYPAFLGIVQSRVSTDAEDARRLGLLRDVDTVGVDADTLLATARRTVLERVRDGLAPQPPHPLLAFGRTETAVLELVVFQLQQAGYATEHDLRIGSALAGLLGGGDLASGTELTEEYVDELTRNAFVELCRSATAGEMVAASAFALESRDRS